MLVLYGKQNYVLTSRYGQDIYILVHMYILTVCRYACIYYGDRGPDNKALSSSWIDLSTLAVYVRVYVGLLAACMRATS